MTDRDSRADNRADSRADSRARDGHEPESLGADLPHLTRRRLPAPPLPSRAKPSTS